MLKDLFRKPKYVTVRTETSGKEVPDTLWLKCPNCGEIIYTKELERNLKICRKCSYHFRLTADERIAATLDEGSFIAYDPELNSANPLLFPDYEEKIQAAQRETGLNEAVLIGEGMVSGQPVVMGVLDSRFIMGSMGSAVGEKIARAFERAREKRLPVVMFSASGGARMQEGLLSLMQMAKTSSALNRFSQDGLLFVSVLTDPTTGGGLASFASLGDIILAEPGALIGFTGPRVIEQTIHQKLPPDFQKAETLLRQGFVDLVVERSQMRPTIGKLLAFHAKGGDR
jgi:acetyl-CoA carboxylase carboxyl transferase subunit beta